MKYCSNCGNKINENTNICLKCGALLNQDVTNNQEYSNNSISGKGLSIAGMVLGIISLILAILLVLN